MRDLKRLRHSRTGRQLVPENMGPLKMALCKSRRRGANLPGMLFATFPGEQKETVMTKHRTGTRAEWRTARLELPEAEKELTRRGDELARRRQELPWVRIDKAYRFETEEGKRSASSCRRAST